MTWRSRPLPLLRRACLLGVLLLLSAAHAEARWLKAPHPDFPKSVRQAGWEGDVKLRVVVDRDGKVQRATLMKGSGHKEVDDEAVLTAKRWRRDPASIKPADLTTGIPVVIEFRLEAPAAAAYSTGRAAFGSYADVKLWVYAPFPVSRHRWVNSMRGKVVVRLKIGRGGHVVGVEKLQGAKPELDNLVISTMQRWRARPELAGKSIVIPVVFGGSMR